MVDLIKAIQALDPNAWVGVSNNDIDKINWHDGNPNKITKEQIQSKYDELVKAYKKFEYQRQREQEYPDLQDCIHAILDGGKTLEDLQKMRADIKKKFPKPK